MTNIQYKLINDSMGNLGSVTIVGTTMSIPMNSDNTDYQTFKTAVLNQEPGNSVVEDGDSFSLNTSPDDSILEDAEGNVMTIDEAKAYVRTLP
jgi:hypothetical protein